MTYPIVDLAFWSPGDGRNPGIDALLANGGTPLARHGLTGIASAYASETGAPMHPVLRQWADELATRSIAVDGALTEVVPALQAIGVPFFVSKGPTLAYTHYANPALRPYVDLDVYVIARADHARSTLMGMGYTPVAKAVGPLGGLARELRGGSFGAVVEVHEEAIDNLHRRWIAPLSAYREFITVTEILGVEVPVLTDDAAKALHAIHLGGGHRFAKLVLHRDLQSHPNADVDIIDRLGAGPYVEVGTDVAARWHGHHHCSSGRTRLAARLLADRDPAEWDEFAIRADNVWALLATCPPSGFARASFLAARQSATSTQSRKRVHVGWTGRARVRS